MANRAELKAHAKECLRQYYWMALLVSVIASLFGVGQGYSFNFNVSSQNSVRTGQYDQDMDHLVYLTFILIVLIAIIVIGLIIIIFRAFVSSVVEVGLCSYFIESRKTKIDAGFHQLFYGFGCGHYLNIVKSMFMKNLFIFGWTLLFVIPGIIKSYEYAMVPYLLAEQPDLHYKAALKKSRDMMDGHKFELFILQLSFIGWKLLGMLLCCVGVVFVLPYENATYTEYFIELKAY